ncbi:hypothetical protein CEXT_344311 [Caerostris extrusa]|uniref:Uncharacterized protein n=1 Tax=Caerostris extrusa TaxID=172846 RepID=A0AAV4TWS2_CAEEX|nr:hypothetical protein CEXT_344311 [Caerostris extrusa]
MQGSLELALCHKISENFLSRKNEVGMKTFVVVATKNGLDEESTPISKKELLNDAFNPPSVSSSLPLNHYEQQRGRSSKLGRFYNPKKGPDKLAGIYDWAV